MEYENTHKSYKGQAIAGLTLGIIGTALGLGVGNNWNNGCGNNGGLLNIFGNRNNCGCQEAQQAMISQMGSEIANLRANQYTNDVGSRVYSASVRSAGVITDLASEISKLKSEKYTDGVGIELYKNIVAFSNAEDAKIRDVQAQLSAFMIDMDKKVALNAQAAELNRQYDALARDAGFKLLEQKIDCCCDKANMRIDWNAERAATADCSIVSYINSNFLPGTLKLPITSICPEPATATA
jgi:hypothetical protein